MTASCLPLVCAGPRGRVLTEVADLEALRPAWEELLAEALHDEPTLSPDWLLTWWQVFGTRGGRALRVFAVEEGGRLLGLVPLLARRRFPAGIPFRRLEFLASGEPLADAICSDYLNLIARPGDVEQVATAWLAALARGELGPWEEVILAMMDGESPIPGLLAAKAREAGYLVERDEVDQAPFVPLPTTWEEYLAGLPKKQRYGLRRAQRDFDAWANGRAVFRRVTTREDLARGKQVLTRLHQTRWAAEGRPGVFASAAFTAFHDSLMPRLLARGHLGLFWLEVGGEAVAAQYNITWNNKESFYQCGRRTDLPREVRAGTVLIAHTLREAIHAGRREYDFLAGPTHYKLEFARATRPLVRVRIARRCAAELARNALRGVRQGCRRWLGRPLAEGFLPRA